MSYGSIKYADTLMVEGGLTSYMNSESCSGRANQAGEVEPNWRGRRKSAQRSTNLGQTTLSCKKSTSYRNRNGGLMLMLRANLRAI